jgi:hypothetical protein
LFLVFLRELLLFLADPEPQSEIFKFFRFESGALMEERFCAFGVRTVLAQSICARLEAFGFLLADPPRTSPSRSTNLLFLYSVAELRCMVSLYSIYIHK